MVEDILDLEAVEVAQRKQAEQEKRIRERELGDIRKVISSPEGRRFLWRLIAYCEIYRDGFTGNSATFYNLGRKNVGLFLLNDLMQAKPEAFAQIQQEHWKELKQLKEGNAK